MLLQIDPDNLFPLNLLIERKHIHVDLVYSDQNHPENIFGEIYHKNALMWVHLDMAILLVLAARLLHKNHGWTLVVKDGLRPVEAQEKMIKSPAVLANPQWLEEPRFLSSPGLGGHPRGMAIDVACVDENERNINFGTAFDTFSNSPLPQHNPAHRDYPHQTDEVKENRYILDTAMKQAAKQVGLSLHLLSTEWWDFRFPLDEIRKYAPLSETDLHPWQKMTEKPEDLPEQERNRLLTGLFDRLEKITDF